MTHILIVAIGHRWHTEDHIARDLGIPGGMWRPATRERDVHGYDAPKVIDAGLHINAGLWSLKNWHQVRAELRRRSADIIEITGPLDRLTDKHRQNIREVLISRDPDRVAIAFEMIRALTKASK